jgi:membrane-anchored mycosin MYCP
VNRILAVGMAACAVAVMGSPAAGAITPPQIDPAVPPPTGAAGPVQAMAQRSPCVTSGVMPGSDPGAVNPNQLTLNLSDAWQYSRGEGQAVAVIDTGIKPGPRLPNVEGGGDFVEATNGLTDCDGHGTLVAGLIAGQPGADGFSGVAPAARLISIRQTSARFAPNAAGEDPEHTRAALAVTTLARAIVRAVDLGARVINVSSVTCVRADNTVDQTELGAALRYAAVEKDAVIVAAAGNSQQGLNVGSACPSNPLSDPGRPEDPRNWAAVTSVSIPSVWQPYVLSVGSLTTAGQPSAFTTAGPWIGLAAPGENISSVSNGDGSGSGGLANALPNDRGDLFPLDGTSYAAAYVSGVAALVRSRFPELNAAQVVHRITASAHGAARSPSNLVGAGSVDPVGALTWSIADNHAGPGEPGSRQIAAPPAPQPKDTTPRTIALAGTGALALAVVAAAVIVTHRRKDEDLTDGRAS